MTMTKEYASRLLFLHELALYMFENEISCNYNYVDAVNMMKIAKRYNHEDLLVYLMQFNYEDDIVELAILYDELYKVAKNCYK
jgi:uncharacterized protein YprB with RNaseH-like and TPR domain